MMDENRVDKISIVGHGSVNEKKKESNGFWPDSRPGTEKTGKSINKIIDCRRKGWFYFYTEQKSSGLNGRDVWNSVSHLFDFPGIVTKFYIKFIFDRLQVWSIKTMEL